MKKLVIVESPTKAKTIDRFLGGEYDVLSSYGHVRDLPKSKLGIDVEHDFEPQYVTPRRAQTRVTALKKAARTAERIILATDEDREGEAIAWHLAKALDLPLPGQTPGRGARDTGTANTPVIERIAFHEITKAALEEALLHPRAIDMALVDAQQARRVLDRLVGYQLSPFLWKKIARGLSAGRVQSVALRLIADREEEIRAFKPEQYWTIIAVLAGAHGDFEANVVRVNGQAVPKPGVLSGSEAERIRAALTASTFVVTSVDKKEVRKNPLPPFTTSTLEQAAAKRLGFSSKKTMYLAQQLYEGGHITYMRTDSVNLSQEALRGAFAWIKNNLPAAYQLPAPRAFKNKSRLAQEAHEAVRPTQPENDPASLKLDKDHARVYELIWRRFIASQLPPALFDATRIEITATHATRNETYLLAANGNTLRFDGFLKILPMKFEEKELPALKENEALTLRSVAAERHETEPPPRYNEASLIKTLEKYGIGRPSTYAPTIAVIQERNYVEKQSGRFYPTELGALVNKVLAEHFPAIVDVAFTAKMEEELDEIARGETAWKKVIHDFYGPFSANLKEKYEEVQKRELIEEKTDALCERCGKPMVVKFGRFGKFLACSGFPECRNTKTLKEPPKPTGIPCPKCLASPDPAKRGKPGELIERRVNKRGRAQGKIFWGCNKYPACDHAVWQDPRKAQEAPGPTPPTNPEVAEKRVTAKKRGPRRTR